MDCACRGPAGYSAEIILKGGERKSCGVIALGDPRGLAGDSDISSVFFTVVAATEMCCSDLPAGGQLWEVSDWQPLAVAPLDPSWCLCQGCRLNSELLANGWSWKVLELGCVSPAQFSPNKPVLRAPCQPGWDFPCAVLPPLVLPTQLSLLFLHSYVSDLHCNLLTCGPSSLNLYRYFLW